MIGETTSLISSLIDSLDVERSLTHSSNLSVMDQIRTGLLKSTEGKRDSDSVLKHLFSKEWSNTEDLEVLMEFVNFSFSSEILSLDSFSLSMKYFFHDSIQQWRYRPNNYHEKCKILIQQIVNEIKTKDDLRMSVLRILLDTPPDNFICKLINGLVFSTNVDFKMYSGVVLDHCFQSQRKPFSMLILKKLLEGCRHQLCEEDNIQLVENIILRFDKKSVEESRKLKLEIVELIFSHSLNLFIPQSRSRIVDFMIGIGQGSASSSVVELKKFIPVLIRFLSKPLVNEITASQLGGLMEIIDSFRKTSLFTVEKYVYGIVKILRICAFEKCKEIIIINASSKIVDFFLDSFGKLKSSYRILEPLKGLCECIGKKFISVETLKKTGIFLEVFKILESYEKFNEKDDRRMCSLAKFFLALNDHLEDEEQNLAFEICKKVIARLDITINQSRMKGRTRSVRYFVSFLSKNMEVLFRHLLVSRVLDIIMFLYSTESIFNATQILCSTFQEYYFGDYDYSSASERFEKKLKKNCTALLVNCMENIESFQERKSEKILEIKNQSFRALEKILMIVPDDNDDDENIFLKLIVEGWMKSVIYGFDKPQEESCKEIRRFIACSEFLTQPISKRSKLVQLFLGQLLLEKQKRMRFKVFLTIKSLHQSAVDMAKITVLWCWKELGLPSDVLRYEFFPFISLGFPFEYLTDQQQKNLITKQNMRNFFPQIVVSYKPVKLFKEKNVFFHSSNSSFKLSCELFPLLSFENQGELIKLFVRRLDTNSIKTLVSTNEIIFYLDLFDRPNFTKMAKLKVLEVIFHLFNVNSSFVEELDWGEKVTFRTFCDSLNEIFISKSVLDIFPIFDLFEVSKIFVNFIRFLKSRNRDDEIEIKYPSTLELVEKMLIDLHRIEHQMRGLKYTKDRYGSLLDELGSYHLVMVFLYGKKIFKDESNIHSFLLLKIQNRLKREGKRIVIDRKNESDVLIVIEKKVRFGSDLDDREREVRIIKVKEMSEDMGIRIYALSFLNED